MYLFKANTYAFLFKPTHPSTLGLLRIAFGILMVWQFGSIKEYIMHILTNSKFFLSYDYFHWVKPVAPETMELMFLVGTVAAWFMLFGFLNRLSTAVVFLVWTYIFLLCRGHYTNHYYLFSIVGFWLTATDSNRWMSVDQLIYKYLPFSRGFILGFGEDKTVVPFWQIFVFQLQLTIVYFYGGLAKISWDWFQGYPMRIWLPLKPWLPDLMKTEEVAIFMSWSGFLFDLLIGLVLLSKYRKWGLPFVLFFHITNELTFRTIGGFPHFMAAATLIYFSPSWPQDLIDYVRRGFKKAIPKPGSNAAAKAVVTGGRKAVLGFLMLYFAWQTLYPFRHFLYPGDPSLTGEGSTFAWRMMLTSRDYGAKLKVVVDGQTFFFTGESWDQYLNFRQFTRLCRMPKAIHRFAHFIRDEMRKTDPNVNPEIYPFLIVKYNGRPFRHVMDTTVNLAALPYNEFGHIDYVLQEYMDDPPGSRYNEEVPIND